MVPTVAAFEALEREEQCLLLTFALEREEEESEKATGNLFGAAPPASPKLGRDPPTVVTRDPGAPRRAPRRR